MGKILVPSHKNFEGFDPSFPAQLCARAKQLGASCQCAPPCAGQKNLGANPFKNLCGQVLVPLFLIVNCWGASTPGLFHEYELHCFQPSDINEHIPILRQLARECSSAIEIGVNEIVSTWGILQGLSESAHEKPSYIGIDLKSPVLNRLFLADQLAESSGVSFRFWQANDFDIDIEPTDLLFIDSWHTYCHLTYELEKFSPKVRKYIAMHDTSEPWGNQDEPCYLSAIPNYPPHINRFKRGLWPAVVDFLKTHPEWSLKERRLNNHGFTVLKRKEANAEVIP